MVKKENNFKKQLTVSCYAVTYSSASSSFRAT